MMSGIRSKLRSEKPHSKAKREEDTLFLRDLEQFVVQEGSYGSCEAMFSRGSPKSVSKKYPDGQMKRALWECPN